jgi:hypothetical protein
VTLNVLVRLLTGWHPPPAALWADFENAALTRVDVAARNRTMIGALKFLNLPPARP